MIDFAQYNPIKAPTVPTVPPTQGLNGSADGEDILVALSAPFMPAPSQPMILPDFAASQSVAVVPSQELSAMPAIDSPAPPALRSTSLDKRDPLSPDDSNPSGQSRGGLGGMLGRLILGGSGDESSLDPATQREKSSKRKAAGGASASFANDPESAAGGFMGAPGSGGGSLGSTVGSIAKMFSGLGIGL